MTAQIGELDDIADIAADDLGTWGVVVCVVRAVLLLESVCAADVAQVRVEDLVVCSASSFGLCSSRRHTAAEVAVALKHLGQVVVGKVSRVLHGVMYRSSGHGKHLFRDPVGPLL
jgi:hypothetical protein